MRMSVPIELAGDLVLSMRSSSAHARVVQHHITTALLDTSLLRAIVPCQLDLVRGLRSSCAHMHACCAYPLYLHYEHYSIHIFLTSVPSQPAIWRSALVEKDTTQDRIHCGQAYRKSRMLHGVQTIDVRLPGSS